MRIVRIMYNGISLYASLIENGLVNVQKVASVPDIIPLEEATLLPIVMPSKIICVGLNYKDHAQELGSDLPSEPAFFLKPPTSQIGIEQAIVLPNGVGRVDFEGELAVVIGQLCRSVSPEEARKYIFGYTCANDITARDLQKNEKMFGRCKGFDTFCPIGPWIETSIPSLEDMRIRTYVNDELKQDCSCQEMIFTPEELISSISKVMTLIPGDVILTGTPSGVAPIVHGDTVKVEISSVGILFNPVIALDNDLSTTRIQ